MSEMKEWQKGYELEKLVAIEKQYDHYNSYALSPFGQYKKNDIAKDLYDETLIHRSGVFYTRQECKVKSPITMYQDIVVAEKQKGDIVYSHFSDIPVDYSFVDRKKDSWFILWAEDKKLSDWIFNAPVGWQIKFIGPKITTFGEMYDIFFMGKENSFAQRRFPVVPPEEFLFCKKLGEIPLTTVKAIRETLESLSPDFTNHYSNYNAKRSWSALSLRGYTGNPKFITKPAEMNEKWKQENKDQKFFMQDTGLMKMFPSIPVMLSGMFDGEIHRVRFMKLKPGGGELKRHTDQVDPDCGNQIHRLVRIHFPIVTNDKVMFSVWNPITGLKEDHFMKEGEFWMLDTRKPHTVINNGDTDRIHLVVDVIVTEKLLKLMKG